MAKHKRSRKHNSSTGKSQTLRERQLQIRRRLTRRGWLPWELPFGGAL